MFTLEACGSRTRKAANLVTEPILDLVYTRDEECEDDMSGSIREDWSQIWEEEKLVAHPPGVSPRQGSFEQMSKELADVSKTHNKRLSSPLFIFYRMPYFLFRPVKPLNLSKSKILSLKQHCRTSRSRRLSWQPERPNSERKSKSKSKSSRKA